MISQRSIPASPRASLAETLAPFGGGGYPAALLARDRLERIVLQDSSALSDDRWSRRVRLLTILGGAVGSWIMVIAAVHAL